MTEDRRQVLLDAVDLMQGIFAGSRSILSIGEDLVLVLVISDSETGESVMSSSLSNDQALAILEATVAKLNDRGTKH